MGLLSGVTNMLFGGGGGGGGVAAPSNQTITNTSIPEYARPYVEKTLGQAAALTDIDKNPYQSYGGQRLQGFTPMQEDAFQRYANQQVAGEIGQGSQLATQAGLGAINAGGNYARMATDPGSIGAYMSPYMQNVVDIQKREANRDYASQLGNIKKQAIASGGFGGSRSAVQESEAQRNLGTRLSDLQATGQQQAFQNAQQAQQFGANLGLQGYGQGLQAAATLGQLGQTRFGQEMGISDAIARAGSVQQAQGQQALDLAYQDWMNQKNYPYQQLAFMSDMYRGLPLSQAAQSQYTAGPSTMSQLGGLGTTALGIYGMSGGFKKEGGQIKGYKDGGKIGYLDGGQIQAMSTDQLKELLKSPSLNPLEVAQIQKLIMARERMENNPQADEMMTRSGIGAIGTGDMVPEDTVMAREGGIMGFAGGGTEDRKDYQKWLEDQVKESILAQKDNKAFEKSDAQIAKYAEEMAARREIAPWQAVTQAGLAWMAGKDPNTFANIGAAGQKGLESYARSQTEDAADKKLLLQQQVEAEKAKLARHTGLTGQMQTSLGQMYGKEAALEQARATRENTGAAASKTAFEKAKLGFEKAISVEKQNLMKDKKNTFNYTKDPDKLEADATANVIKRMSIVDPSMLKDLNINPKIVSPEAPSATSKVFPIPSTAAISALKSRKDQNAAAKQFEEIFGPGSAQKALGK